MSSKEPTPSNIDRRYFLQLGASSVAMTLAGAPLLSGSGTCNTTPETITGPAYPSRDQADTDVDLTRVEGRSGQAQGEIIRVRGQVLDEACAPIEGAVVKLWQANTYGRYEYLDYDQFEAPPPGPKDSNFQGWAEAVTGEEGRYGFKTVMPARYGGGEGGTGRTPHIHFRVTHPDHHELITQMFFEGEPLNETDGVVQALSEAERDRLIVGPSSGETMEEDLYPFDLTLTTLEGQVEPEVLARYAGTYELDIGEGSPRVEITRKGRRLYARVPEPFDVEAELRPLSETRFSFVKIVSPGLEVGEKIVFHPEKEPNGALTLIPRSGEEIPGTKVE